MKISSSLRYGYEKLALLDNPHFEADLLLSHVIKKPREWILAHPENRLTLCQMLNYKFQIRRRHNNTPLAYISGKKEFYGLDFYVDKNVLIPRPETEMMVEEAITQATINMQHATIVDIGTGSGCIAIAIAHELMNHESKIKNYALFASDISAKALKIAKKNAKKNNIQNKIKFIQGNLLKPFAREFKTLYPRMGGNSKIIITANLPYLTPDQIKNSPSIKKEPRLALVAGNDGLKYYRELLRQINVFIKTGGCKSSFTCLLEIDDTQHAIIADLIKIELPQATFEIKKDLKRENRLVVIIL